MPPVPSDLPATAAPTNRLLAALPPAEAAQLLPRLTPVRLPLRQVVYALGEPITHVYFPLNALVSLVTVLDDGRQVEMAAIGREGMVGLPLVLGSNTDGHLAMVQIPGDGLRLEAGALRDALAALPGLRRLLLRATQTLFTQAGQGAACNTVHPVAERCARWLLEAHDRVGADSFPLTQDFLAAMLGVHRPSVTVAAGMLQQAGLITYHRGHVTILDRARLEEASCECYRYLAAETDRLLGADGL